MLYLYFFYIFFIFFFLFFFFFFNDTATTEIYTLSLHDALPISLGDAGPFLDEPPDVPGVFTRLMSVGILPVDNLSRILEQASTEEVSQARADARVVAEDLRLVAEALEILVGRGAFGLGVFRMLRRRQTGLVVRVGLVPAMIALRRAWTADEAARFEAVARALESVAPNAGRLLSIRRRLKGGRSKTNN